jgi:trans-2,3-dihydro-3-hydroxyanthranilate isomerase
MTAMRLEFDVVDVFTDRPFAGNQLAVVHGADELSTEQCQALAREFNFSESTFPSAPDGDGYATRIFTPAQEIPFAGHPTLGTAWVLRSRGLLSADLVTQHCGAGEVGVRFDGDLVELSATPRDLAGPVDGVLVREMLREFGLSERDRAGEAWVAGAGLTFVHVPVTEEAVVRAQPSAASFEKYADRLRGLGPLEDLLDAVNLHAVAGDAPHLRVHSRVFVPGAIPEDPATGSAAAGLGMALVASGRLPEGGSYDVRQGVEMGRPSSLRCRVEAADGRATRCHVAGQVRPVASGDIEVPAPAEAS